MTSPFAISLAAHHILQNGIIIYPTETVYGLGCNPANFEAVNKINTLKQRSNKSGLLVIASHIDQLDGYIKKLTQQQLDRIKSTQSITSWITTAHKDAPAWLVSNDKTIGFRITTHPVAKSLCDKLNHPLISTSANFKGRTPVANTLECHLNFNGLVDFILTSSETTSGTPSTIKHLENDSVIRN